MGTGTFYNVVARLSFLASGYVLAFGMARWLPSAAEYGRFGLLMGLITLARTVLSTGLPQAITRFVAAHPDAAEGTYRRGAFLQMAAATVLWALFAALVPTVSRLLGDAELQSPLWLASPLLMLMAFYQVNLGYITGRAWFGRQAFLTFAYSALRCGAAAALVVAGFGIHGAVSGLLFATGAVAVLSFFLIPCKNPGEGALPVSRFLDFSWPLVIFSFGVSGLLNLDLLLMGRYFPNSDQVGFYSGAVNLGKAPYFAFYAFASTTLPSLARLHGAGDVQRLESALRGQLRALCLAAFPCSALLAASGAEALDLVYGAAFAPAAPALCLLAFSSTALSLLGVLGSALTACGKPRAAMLIVVCCLPLQCLLGALLIPRGGMLGAAASNLAVTTCGVGVAYWLARRTVGKVWDARALSSALVSATLAGATLYVGPPAAGLWLIPKLTFGFLVYGVAVLLTGGLTFGEVAAFGHKVLRRA